MYYSLYTSSDYYEEDDSLKEDNVKICLICWLPNNNNDLVKNMKQFAFILTTCDCNALFHHKCLKTWIENSQSCPICRKQLAIRNIYNLNHNIHIKLICFFFFYNYTNVFLQIINIFYIINLFLLYAYVLYIILLVNTHFEYENYV